MSNDVQQKDQFAEVKRLADEFRVKAHLASMDAKTKWDEELRPKLRKLEREFDKAVDRADLSGEISKLEKSLRKLVEDISDSES